MVIRPFRGGTLDVLSAADELKALRMIADQQRKTRRVLAGGWLRSLLHCPAGLSRGGAHAACLQIGGFRRLAVDSDSPLLFFIFQAIFSQVSWVC